MGSWIVYLLIFGLAAVAASLAQSGLRRALRDRSAARARFASTGSTRAGEADLASLRRRVSRLGSTAIGTAMQRLLVQSGTQLTVPALGGVVTLIAVAAFLLLPIPFGPVLRLAVCVTLSVGLAMLHLRMRRRRRIAKFGEQLPDVLDVIVRGLRAGHPLTVSLALVARETPAPAGPEFAILIDEVSYGRSVAEALENLHDRVGHPELRFFVASTSIALQTGGNLGEILSRLARMLRERFRLARRVRALSAEGRFSGLALSGLPIILFALINVVSASYYAEFWDSPSSGRILALAAALLAVGNLLIYRLVNFRV